MLLILRPDVRRVHIVLVRHFWRECWSTDPHVVDKVHDVVGLYLDPPERALVLCVDEKEPDPGPGPHRAGAASPAGHPGTG
jgi:hypothetical protein